MIHNKKPSPLVIQLLDEAARRLSVLDICEEAAEAKQDALRLVQNAIQILKGEQE